MLTNNIRYSQRTCFVYKQNQLIGKIQFQRDANIGIWQVRYLSSDLPIHSADQPSEIHSKLSDLGLSWRWGKIYHRYRQQRS
ncbi:MAG: hypothetical protein ABJV04_17770 [Aliiglaciecola sp.]|uniref:hypothetical protein n=1 Tax=unclassified Aliiglaciecola TaxID=2593648 RepID=UPI003298C2B9